MNELVQCKQCGHIAPIAAFYPGRGRDVFEHPDHRYCPNCGGSIDWYGYRHVVLADTSPLSVSLGLHDWAKADQREIVSEPDYHDEGERVYPVTRYYDVEVRNCRKCPATDRIITELREHPDDC